MSIFLLWNGSSPLAIHPSERCPWGVSTAKPSLWDQSRLCGTMNMDQEGFVGSHISQTFDSDPQVKFSAADTLTDSQGGSSFIWGCPEPLLSMSVRTLTRASLLSGILIKPHFEERFSGAKEPEPTCTHQSSKPLLYDF